jgi:hypothetical protein
MLREFLFQIALIAQLASYKLEELFKKCIFSSKFIRDVAFFLIGIFETVVRTFL